MKKYISIAFIAIGFLACNTASDYKQITSDPSFYANTVHELNQVVMGNNFSPIVASRNYAYASIAGYEVTAAGSPSQYQSLAGQLKGLSTIPLPEDTSNIDFPFAAVRAFSMVGEAVTFPEGRCASLKSCYRQGKRWRELSELVRLGRKDQQNSFAQVIGNVQGRK